MIKKEVVNKEAEPRIIHVGEGVNDGTHTITETREIAFETKIEFDDNLKPGEEQVFQEGEAGEEQRTITLTIEDGKVTGVKLLSQLTEKQNKLKLQLKEL